MCLICGSHMGLSLQLDWNIIDFILANTLFVAFVGKKNPSVTKQLSKTPFLFTKFVVSWFVYHCFTPFSTNTLIMYCLRGCCLSIFLLLYFFHRNWASKMRILVMEKLKENSQRMVIHNKTFKWPWNNNSTFELLLLVPLV